MILSWQQIPSTMVSELLCYNFDGVVIDTEHSMFNNETIFSCIQVITNLNKKCFVRVSEPNLTLVRSLLDSGITGIIFANVETKNQCENIINMCRFPIYGGKRGLGLVRENFWGKKNLISDPPIIIPQIETIKAVNNIKDITSFNFQKYLIGPYDLSMSIGFPGDFNNKNFINAINKIKLNIKKENMAVHIPDKIEDEIDRFKDLSMICLGMDSLFILNSSDKLNLLLSDKGLL